ncbi:MAG: glutamate--tRNA ligase [Candidatus Firestonebacteria bacterium]
MSVKVRFAPSPTGFLHIGGARSALFNYLFARHNNGKFVLRIEDTDTARSKKEFEENIIDSLKWLKMDWEEFYRQSERMEIYKKYLDQLLAENKAYKCFCSKEEIEEKRRKYELMKLPFRYDGKCGKLTGEETGKLEAEGKPYVVRFRITRGHTEINDLVRGKITFDNKELDDFVLTRSDKVPTYNFCVVIDDALMEITHVFRGEEHISNTPRQVELFKALGFKVPDFAHIPLILNKDRTKMSKRNDTVAVTEYRNEGFHPEAIINFLSLLGCSYGSNDTIYDLKTLIEKFSVEKINKSPAVFDMDKLEWMNGFYTRQRTDAEIAGLTKKYLTDKGYLVEDEKLIRVMKLEKERLKKMEDIVENAGYFFTDNIDYDKEAYEKHFKNAETLKLISEYEHDLRHLSPFDAANLEKFSREFVEKRGKKLKDLVHPVRLALTGKLVSSGLFEVMEILGKDVVLHRLNIQ